MTSRKKQTKKSKKKCEFFFKNYELKKIEFYFCEFPSKYFKNKVLQNKHYITSKKIAREITNQKIIFENCLGSHTEKISQRLNDLKLYFAYLFV